MALFWRINSNQLTPLYETQHVGFPINDPSYIPDEYLNNKKFIVFRTCHSIGDWGIISAFPRLLKQKYPDCNNSDSRKSDIINKIILESMETNKEKTDKIIKKIAKEVGIDRETHGE